MNPPSVPTTMQQIADAAGVSRMAVSLALRNSPKISPATASRIRKLADELGYRPNPMVSALMTQLRHTREVKKPTVLAYVTAYPTEEGWKRSVGNVAVYEGASRRALELGYSLEEWWVRQPGMSERRFSDILHTRNILGLILSPMPGGAGALELEWSRFAAATVGYSLAAPEIARASNDHFGSINIALRELGALGYRRIGLALMEDDDVRVRQQWIAAMLAYQQGLALADRVPTFAGNGPVARAFTNWFQEHQPHAVLSVGTECLRVFADLGLRVPQDVGFANLSLGAGNAEMAGVNQNSDLVGVAAVDLVDGQLRRNEHGIPLHPRTLLIPGEWVPGPSVRDLRASPRRVRVKA